MDFSLSSDQRLIKDSVDSFVADNYDFAKRDKLSRTDDGFSKAHWKAMADLGWFGLAFPEEKGGFGGTPVETMILMEAFGKGLVLEPYLPSVILAGTALAHGGTTAEHAQRLEAMIGGEQILTFASAEPRSRYDYTYVTTTAKRDGSDYVVDGEKRAVPFAAAAGAYVVTVRTSGEAHAAQGLSLALVDADAPGITRRDYRTVDGQRASDVTFAGVRVPASAIIGEPGEALPTLDLVVDHGIGALAAESVGLMSVMQKTTTEYLKQRHQFGVPIGSFQALQHKNVDMLIEAEMARSITFYGTMALLSETDPVQRKRALSATKVQIARSGRFVGQNAIQLHGGIGMSEEYFVGHYFKRMTMIEQLLGDVDYHLKRYLAGEPALHVDARTNGHANGTARPGAEGEPKSSAPPGVPERAPPHATSERGPETGASFCYVRTDKWASRPEFGTSGF